MDKLKFFFFQMNKMNMYKKNKKLKLFQLSNIYNKDMKIRLIISQNEELELYS